MHFNAFLKLPAKECTVRLSLIRAQSDATRHPLRDQKEKEGGAGGNLLDPTGVFFLSGKIRLRSRER